LKGNKGGRAVERGKNEKEVERIHAIIKEKSKY
jgi:hypothetical protein